MGPHLEFSLLPFQEQLCHTYNTCCVCAFVLSSSVLSDSLRPRGLQPARLLCLWDSPGKSTGVGSHFLLQCMKGKSESEVSQSCPTLRDRMDCSLPGSSVHGIFQARVLEWAAIGSVQIILPHKYGNYNLLVNRR